jgi:hypothetical protein
VTTPETIGVVSGIAGIGALILRVLWQVARIDFRVEEMWRVFMMQPPETPGRGRRKYDRTINPLSMAHDRAPKIDRD